MRIYLQFQRRDELIFVHQIDFITNGTYTSTPVKKILTITSIVAVSALRDTLNGSCNTRFRL